MIPRVHSTFLPTTLIKTASARNAPPTDRSLCGIEVNSLNEMTLTSDKSAVTCLRCLSRLNQKAPKESAPPPLKSKFDRKLISKSVRQSLAMISKYVPDAPQPVPLDISQPQPNYIRNTL